MKNIKMTHRNKIQLLVILGVYIVIYAWLYFYPNATIAFMYILLLTAICNKHNCN